MPNSVISVTLHDDGVRLDVAVPEPELRLALMNANGESPTTAPPAQADVEAYFNRHLSIRSRDNVLQPFRIDAVSRVESKDENVGTYAELRVSVTVPTDSGVDPRDFTLGYDAVMHQIPNHIALVQIVRDFRNGILEDGPAQLVGTIAFDFQSNSVSPLRVRTESGSLWRGIGALVSLGVHRGVGDVNRALSLLVLLITTMLVVVDARCFWLRRRREALTSH